jgi:hypothetical protein
MDRRKGPGVTGIQELQKIEGLAAPDFSELHDSYAFGWCELKRGVLTVIPHPMSSREIRRFDHPREAEIIGRVTAVAMRLAKVTKDGEPGTR